MLSCNISLIKKKYIYVSKEIYVWLYITIIINLNDKIIIIKNNEIIQYDVILYDLKNKMVII